MRRLRGANSDIEEVIPDSVSLGGKLVTTWLTDERFLDEEGPGLHYINMEVEDIHATAAELERLGGKPFGGIQHDGMWNLTYIHPRDSGGILYQLFVSHAAPYNDDRWTPSGGICGVKRVDHVSHATKDLEQQIAFQQRIFGMELTSRWDDEELGYHGAVMRIPGSLLEFEMIQPSRPDSFVQRFIDARRPGVHHICIEVESVDRTVEALKRSLQGPQQSPHHPETS